MEGGRPPPALMARHGMGRRPGGAAPNSEPPAQTTLAMRPNSAANAATLSTPGLTMRTPASPVPPTGIPPTHTPSSPSDSSGDGIQFECHLDEQRQPGETTGAAGRGTLKRLAWSPDGKTIAVAGSLGVWLYAAGDFDVAPTLLESHAGEVTGVAFSPDGSSARLCWRGQYCAKGRENRPA